MNNPEYIIVNGNKIKINTDFRIALECQRIAQDDEIDNYERALAIIYKLFGSDALNDEDNLQEYFKKAQKYLNCGKESETTASSGEPTFDYEQDWGFVKASFMSDYGINLDKEKMHWWSFFDLLNGLTPNSILNRVRQVRDEPLAGKKGKELEQWIKAKKSVELKRKKTQHEKELDKWWEEQLGGKK